MKEFNRPNVLFLLTDQQRFDSLKCYGNNLAVTPNLDRLAGEGAKLNNFFVQNPVCTPSRISMLTGRYPSSTGIGCNGVVFPEDRLVPINQLMKPYGYHTAQIGKLHFDPHSNRDHKNPTSAYGFDTFILSDEPGCYDDAYTKWIECIDENEVIKARTSLPPAAVDNDMPEYSTIPRETHEPYVYEGDEDYTHSAFVTSEVCRFIRQHSKENFFAIGGFYAPHTPVNPPKKFVDMYLEKDIPLPKKGEMEDWMPLLRDVDEKQWKKVIAYYLALVSHVDDCVGQILKTLEEEGLLENTIVIFTSDHGEFLGDHGRIQKGMPGQDCVTKVPCLIRYPKQIMEQTEIQSITEAVDLVPTILDLCGIQIPTYIQGKSMKKLLQNKTGEHKEAALTEYFDMHMNRSASIRTSDYRYYIDDKGSEILFDLSKDPDELINVVEEQEYTEDLSKLRKIMIQKLFQSGYYMYDRKAKY